MDSKGCGLPQMYSSTTDGLTLWSTMHAELVITPFTDVRALSPGTLLTEDDIATICRVEPATVKKWRSIKRGPRFIPLARQPLYEARDVAAWIDALRGDE